MLRPATWQKISTRGTRAITPDSSLPTKVISSQGNDGSSSNIDWDLREGEISGDGLWSGQQLPSEP